MTARPSPDLTARRGVAVGTDLVRWGPIVAGVVVGLGAFALLDALWLAMAAGHADGLVAGNLDWFVGGTAIGALLVAGFVAGLTSGARGVGAGLANGVTTWGLLVVLSLLVGIPGVLALNAVVHYDVTARSALWTLFWSLLIGLGCAALGGMLGGVIRRSVAVAEARTTDETPAVSQPGDAPADTVRMTGNQVVETPHEAARDRDGASRVLSGPRN